MSGKPRCDRMYSHLEGFFWGSDTSLQVFMPLNLNPVMSIIADFHLCLFYSWALHGNLQQIVAGRVVRCLNNSTSTGRWFVPVRIHRKVHGAVLTRSQGSTVAFRSGASGFRGKRSTTILKDGVHVHVCYSFYVMEHLGVLIIIFLLVLICTHAYP
jgi:hypothetical protein